MKLVKSLFLSLTLFLLIFSNLFSQPKDIRELLKRDINNPRHQGFEEIENKFSEEDFANERLFNNPLKTTFETVDVVDSVIVMQSNGYINKYLYTYDSNGNLTSELFERWDGTNWIRYFSYQYTYTFDSNGFMTSWLQEKWDGTNWVNYGSKYTYTNDSNGNLTSLIYERWDGTNWVNWGSKYTYTNDSNGNLTSELREQWNGQSYSMNQEQYTYTYDSSGNLISTLFERMAYGNWENWRRYTYTYDSNGNRTSELQESSYFGEEWYNFFRYAYIYDSNGNLTSWLQEKWDRGNWENLRRYTDTYDSNGNMTSELRETWFGTNWVNSERYTYTYDSNGNMTSMFEQWDGTNWVMRDVDFYFSDNSDKGHSFSGSEIKVYYSAIIDIPSVTILQSPISESENNLLPIKLTWNKSDLAESYRVWCSIDSNFTTTILDSSEIVDTGFVLNGLHNSTTYFWRVKAINAGSESNWSEIWNFKTLGEPTTVTQLYPSGDAVNIPISLTFNWNKAEDQLSALFLGGEVSSVALPKSLLKSSKKKDGIQSISNYWFELNLDTTTSSVVVDSSLSDTTKHVSGLTNSSDYYWRVRAKNETGWGGYSNWSKFTTIIDTPSVVVLESPLNNSAGLLSPIELKWLKSNLATNYNLQVSLDSLFLTTAVHSIGLVDTTYILPKLNNLSTYFWRVSSTNIGGTNAWSDAWNFKTLGEPTEVSLISPISDTTNQPTSINFIWSRAIDKTINIIGGINNQKDNIQTVSNYWFELTKDVNSNPIIIDSSLTDTTKLVNNLEHLTEYWWHIKSKNEVGWSNFTAWSKFTTVINIPNVVVLLNPAKDSKNNSIPVTLSWNKSDLAESYLLQLSTDVNFATTVLDSNEIADTSFVLAELNNLTTYYWRIKADNIGGASEWSEVWSFATLGVPTAPNLILPENNLELTDTTNSIEFIWSSVGIEDSYSLEASVNESFDSLFVSINDLTDTNYIYSNQLVPGKFYWRVNAKNQAGIGDWSNIYSFTITLTDVDQLGNIIPQEYVLYQNYPNPFNPSTIVKYGLPEQSNIKIEIFNMLGQSVGVLVNDEKSAGFYETTWNAKNSPSGIYLISIRAEGLSSKKNFVQVKKALLLK